MLRLNVDLKAIMGKGTMLEDDDEEYEIERAIAPRPRDELEEPAIIITNIAPTAIAPSTVVLPNVGQHNGNKHRNGQLQGGKKIPIRPSNALQDHLQAQPAPLNVKLQLQVIDIADNSAIYNYNTVPSVYHHHNKHQELVSSIISKTSPGKNNNSAGYSNGAGSPTQQNNNANNTNNTSNTSANTANPTSAMKAPIPIAPTSYSPNERAPRPKLTQKPGSPPIAKELNFESLVLTNSKPNNNNNNNKAAGEQQKKGNGIAVHLNKVNIYPERKEQTVEAVESSKEVNSKISSTATVSANNKIVEERKGKVELVMVETKEEEVHQDLVESPTTISAHATPPEGRQSPVQATTATTAAAGSNVHASAEKLMVPTSVYDFDSNFDSMKPQAPSSSMPSKKLSKFPSPRQKNTYTFRYKSNKEKMLFIQSVYGNGMPLNILKNAANLQQAAATVSSEKNKSPPRGNELFAGESVYDTDIHLHCYSDEISESGKAIDLEHDDDAPQELRTVTKVERSKAASPIGMKASRTTHSQSPTNRPKPVGSFEAMLPTIDIIQLRSSMQGNVAALGASMNASMTGTSTTQGQHGGILYHPLAKSFDLSKHQNVHTMPSVVITNYQQAVGTQRIVQDESIAYHPDFDGQPDQVMAEPQINLSSAAAPDPFMYIMSKSQHEGDVTMPSMATSQVTPSYLDRNSEFRFEDEDVDADPATYSLAPPSTQFQQPAPTQPHYEQLYQNIKPTKGSSMNYPTSPKPHPISNSAWSSPPGQSVQPPAESSPSMTHKQLNKLSRDTKLLKQQQQGGSSKSGSGNNGLVIVVNADNVKRMSMSPRSTMKEQISQYKKRLTNSTSNTNPSPPMKNKPQAGAVTSAVLETSMDSSVIDIDVAPAVASVSQVLSLASKSNESTAEESKVLDTESQRGSVLDEEDHDILLVPRSIQKATQRSVITHTGGHVINKTSTLRKHKDPNKKIIPDDGDERGVYRGEVGDFIADKYEIIYLLGQGVFGSVYHCRNIVEAEQEGAKSHPKDEREEEIAVKVTHRHELFHKQAKKELQILSLLRDAKLTNGTTPYGSAEHVVDFLGSFQFQGHYGFLFPVYDLNLFEYIRSLDFVPMNVEDTAVIARQLFSALAYIHTLGIVHADIKPENILLRHPKENQKINVVLVDFGSAILLNVDTATTPSKPSSTSNNLVPYIQSRFYRAPEVICGLGQYTMQIDVWSTACVLAECLMGTPLFIGEDNVDQLAVIAEVLGPIPSEWQRQYIPPMAVTKSIAEEAIQSAEEFNNDEHTDEAILVPVPSEVVEGTEDEHLQLSVISAVEEVVIPPQHQVSLLDQVLPTAEQPDIEAESSSQAHGEVKVEQEDVVTFTCYDWVPTFSLPRSCTSHILAQSSTFSNRRSIIVTKSMSTSMDQGDILDHELGEGFTIPVQPPNQVRDYCTRNLRQTITHSQKWTSRKDLEQCINFLEKCLMYLPSKRLYTIPPTISDAQQAYSLASNHLFLAANSNT